jgi:acyl carrier protein
MTIAPTSNPTALDRDELRDTLAEVLDVDVEAIGDDTDFIDDLGIDSLMALEVVVVLEKAYGVRLSEADLRRVSCLDNAYDLLAGKLGQVGG